MQRYPPSSENTFKSGWLRRIAMATSPVAWAPSQSTNAAAVAIRQSRASAAYARAAETAAGMSRSTAGGTNSRYATGHCKRSTVKLEAR